jgi:glycosyltransferase involved in cell wall biosynthesis
MIMSVYNGERHLREAMDSILEQTFQDFEFVIVDDASTDSTPAILEGYTDSRLIRLHNQNNIALTRSLNRGLAVTRGEYIGRMDAEDVSLPERLERQVAYLDAHPEVALATAAFIFMDETGNEKIVSRPPTDRGRLREALMRGNQFCHGVVIRTDPQNSNHPEC